MTYISGWGERDSIVRRTPTSLQVCHAGYRKFEGGRSHSSRLPLIERQGDPHYPGLCGAVDTHGVMESAASATFLQYGSHPYGVITELLAWKVEDRRGVHIHRDIAIAVAQVHERPPAEPSSSDSYAQFELAVTRARQSVLRSSLEAHLETAVDVKDGRVFGPPPPNARPPLVPP
jgi:hypothetical protein